MTRFDLDMDGSMEPSEHGGWVRYEDVQAREWVGLTDEEVIEALNGISFNALTGFNIAKAIEAKLKEKNCA